MEPQTRVVVFGDKTIGIFVQEESDSGHLCLTFHSSVVGPLTENFPEENVNPLPFEALMFKNKDSAIAFHSMLEVLIDRM